MATFHATTTMIFFILPHLSPFFQGICLSRQGGFEPWSLCSSEACVASANVNANEMSAVPLPVDTLKKNSAKKGGGGGGGHVGSTIYFWAGSLHLFMNASMHKRKKIKINRQKNYNSFQVWKWCRNHHQLTTPL